VARPAHASSAGGPRPGGRLPDFFVVGHAKSGTTALYEMLRHHPQVHLGRKEPRYFAAELYERDIPRGGGPPTPKTLPDYEAWFSRAQPGQRVGDVSPDYLWSRLAADSIADVRPDGLIIAILREPVDFLVSLHRQLLQVYAETETDFARALALEDARREGRELPRNTFWPKALFYSERVRYVEQLRRFQARFPASQMLVLIYDDYRADNIGTLREVMRFIGVEEDYQPPASEANESVQVGAPGVNGMLRRLIVAEGAPSRALKRSLTAITPMRMRQRTLQATRKRLIYDEPTPPDPALVAELRRRFEPEVAALGEHLGRDLVSLWGYERP
jgi:hypothetical protein